MAYRTRLRHREDTVPRTDDDWPQTPPTVQGSRGGGFGVLAVVLAAIVLALVGWIIYEAVTEDSESLEIGATVSEIAEDPNKFVGESVAVSAEVTDVRGPSAVAIGDEELLILGDGIPAKVSEGDVLQALGTVRIVNQETAEEDFGLDLGDDVLDDFDGKPAVAANEINLDPRVEAGPQNVTVTDLVEIAGELEGERVTVAGDVTRVLEPGVFVLDRLVPVFGAEAPSEVTMGSRVRVTGIVHEDFEVAGFEDELGTDLDPGLYTGWVGQPAIAATQVKPVG